MLKEYRNTPIFNRRNEEWFDNIKDHIYKIFSNVELIKGFKLESCTVNKVNKRSEEIKKKLVECVNVKISTNEGKELSYNILIPLLIENHFFFLGSLKIPFFQIFDFPIIYRKGIRFRNNAISLSLINNTDKLSIFKKEISIALLISLFHTKSEFDEFINCRKMGNPILDIIIEKCNDLYKMSEEERLVNLTMHFKDTIDCSKKAQSYLFSLRVAYQIDHFCIPFYKEKSILFEILGALCENKRPDTDYNFKRVRFVEYVLAPLIKKVYDLIVTLYIYKTFKKSIFQISKDVVLEKCVTSEIIRFNLPINPITELSSLLNIVLTGPGGLKKDTISPYMRDIDDSQYGIVCPADTPDRDGCGVVLNLIPTVQLDDIGRFIFNKIGESEIISSLVINLIPFLEKDDQARLQMASNHIKQAICLTISKSPMIKSGLEDAYLDETTFLYKAKNDGKVVYKDSKFMVVKYKDNQTQVLRLGHKSLYLSNVDIMITELQEHSEFKKDSILCHSSMIKNGEINLGNNLLTAFSSWKGYTYEDSIVISEDVKNKFESIHSEEIFIRIDTSQILKMKSNNKMLPDIGDKIIPGEPIAQILTIEGEYGFEINYNTVDIYGPIYSCEVTDIEIYAVSWNRRFREYDDYITGLINAQSDKISKLRDNLRSYLTSDEIDQLFVVNDLSKFDVSSSSNKKFSLKGRTVNGIIVKLQVSYTDKADVGDKLSNRHGNKGTISCVLPVSHMPKLPDGRIVDIILNPLGVISRMNVGQLYELHVTEALYQLKNKMRILSNEDKLKLLDEFLNILSNYNNKEEFIQIIRNNFINGNYDENSILLIQPPFKSILPDNLAKLLELAGSKEKQEILDPSNGLTQEVAVGYNYILKLVHRAGDKVTARSIGPYSKKTLQPLGGKSRKGGHRLGEMESWSMLAHGADQFLKTLLTTQSDSPGLKNKYLCSILRTEVYSNLEQDERTQSARIYEKFLTALGLSIIDKDIK